MNNDYDPAAVESAAQQYWMDNHSFEVKEDLSREKFYCLSMLPYPSGELHMGHVRNYTIGDVISRYQWMKGKNVLQPMGWDAFGLPAENAAIERKLPPSQWTHKNINKMRKQFQQLGYAFDWKREITTCEPEFYRWEQWLFLQLFKKGLAYRKNAMVNWDPVDQTVLANEQVVDGKGWRSKAPVERREIPQWFFKITDYADELLAGLDEMPHWPEQVKSMQRHWIGRKEGVLVKFSVSKHKQPLEIFTTRLDTLMGVTYMAIAPQHPLAKLAGEQNEKVAKFLKKCQKIKVAEADIATQEKAGVDTGLVAIHPINKQKLPIWVTNYILMEYGNGAVMAVPAHDQRDFEFAQKYSLPLKPVIIPPKKTKWDFTKKPYTESGTLIDSEQFDGLKSKKAIKDISDFLTEKKLAKPQVNYRLRDWGISRQRYWGTPIPIIYCKQCGTVPVPEADLPVVLPTELIPNGHGSPLKDCPEFYKTKCPQCHKAAKREIDTMDTFVESSWYYARYCSNDQSKIMLDDRAKYWTPVDQYVGGIEHAVMHLLYARFMHKLLRDQGLLNSNEPFSRLLTQGMVLKDGKKMSKSHHNVVAPQALIKKYGTDTVRLFIIFASPPDQDLEWSDSGVEGAFRFLKKLWHFADSNKAFIQTINQQPQKAHYEMEKKEQQEAHKLIHDILDQASHDIERLQFNTLVSAAMKLLNVLMRIHPTTEIDQKLIHEGLSILLRILAPITPHITHQLWQQLEYGESILWAGWPKVNIKAQQTTSIQFIVQINGKLRASIQVPAECAEDDIKQKALNEKNVAQHIKNKTIKKIIVIPKRLINIVV